MNVRRLWRVGGSLLVVAFLVQGTINWVSQLAHEEYTEQEVVPASGITEVEIRNHAGQVEVTSAPPGTEEITVTAEISDGLQRTRRSREVVDGRLELDASCPLISDFCSVRYEVEMPADIDLTVRTLDGQVAVRGLDGRVEALSRGRIDARELSGTVRLHSQQSRVEAHSLTSEDVEVVAVGRAYVELLEPPRRVSARGGTFGTVEVVVPDDGGTYRLDVSALLGNTETGTVRHDPDSDRVIEARGNLGVVVRHP
jgi:hypothetical protein